MKKHRMFDSMKGDRVARRRDDSKRPTYDFTEAFEYAHKRALKTGRRVIMYRKPPRQTTHTWWLVLVTDIPITMEKE